MDEMIEALSSIASLMGIKDGVEPIQAIASSVGLSWADLKGAIDKKEFSFDEVKDIIERFGNSLKVGSDQDDDQSEQEELGSEKQEILSIGFLQKALLDALGVNNENNN